MEAFLDTAWKRLTHDRQSIMAPLSEFQQAARLRWPHYNIHGDGPCAVVCPISYSVQLYPFAMMAMADIARDHGNWDCKDGHSLVELKPAPRRKITHGPDSERD